MANGRQKQAHLAQHVGGRVPESLLALRVVERAELEGAVALQGPEHIPLGAIHHGHDDLSSGREGTGPNTTPGMVNRCKQTAAAANTFFARPALMPLATSIGVVKPLTPGRVLPSGSVTVMGTFAACGGRPTRRSQA